MTRVLEIKTVRLNLCVPTPQEAPAALHFYLANQEHFRATDPVWPKNYYTLEYWQRRLALSIEEIERDQSVRLFFEPHETPGEFVGTATLTQIARGPFQACYLGYSLHHAFQGRGLINEALTAAIKFAFEEKCLHRIMANHLPENTRSANVLKRLKFNVDGHSPDYLFIQGQWRAHVLNSLTNTNWRPRTEDQALFSSVLPT